MTEINQNQALFRKASQRAFEKTLGRVKRTDLGFELKRKHLSSSYIGEPPLKSLSDSSDEDRCFGSQYSQTSRLHGSGHSNGSRNNGSRLLGSALGKTLRRRKHKRKNNSNGRTSRNIGSLLTETGLKSQAQMLLDEVLLARQNQVCPIASRNLVRSIESPGVAVALSGGNPVEKQGFAGVIKSYSNGRGNRFHGKDRLLPSFKRNVLNLVDGHLELYMPPKNFNESIINEESLDMCKKVNDVKLVHLEMVYYPSLESKHLVLVAMQPIGKTESDGEDKVKHNKFREELVFIKFETSTEAQEWAQAILRELQNQAIMYDRYADILRTNPFATQEMVDTFLRCAVDMWTLAKGPNHPLVVGARDRLVEWLEKCEKTEEAQFWSDLSATPMIELPVLNVALDDLRTRIEEEFPYMAEYKKMDIVTTRVVGME